MERVSLTLPGGGALIGDYEAGSQDRNFAVVWAHGFGSHRGGEKAGAVWKECQKRRWAFASFDFRCHGESSGTMLDLRASGLIHDLAAVGDFLRSRGHSRLGLIGSSMGGFACAWFSVQQPQSVVGCVFLAPGFGFVERRWERLTHAEREDWKRTSRLRITNEWIDTELPYAFFEEHEQFRPQLLASRWSKPALIFQGLHDDVVPVASSLDFIRNAAYPGVELRLLKSGDHRLTSYQDEIAAEACRFFERLISSPIPLPEAES